ncbi:MAG: diguanylate cyclase [Campylobacterota bacterium]|nr:diguanylate cyclase [Campylobacterota bacterium]
MKNLQTHFEILLHSQKITSENLYKRTINTEGFDKIMRQAKSADEEQRTLLRKQLHVLLKDNYGYAKRAGVLQYHFVFPNNRVFLRMHKLDKFGDDLTAVREDFAYTNRTEKPISGFTQGRTAHAFRNAFPLFDVGGEHIGAMEVSFSSDGFQEYLTEVSHIHTHFLVKKDIFDAKTWERDDLILKYHQSAEHSNYMMTMNRQHSIQACIVDNRVKLESVIDIISQKEALGKAFSVYVENEDKQINVVSFLPIKNINEKLVAWLVSYEKDDFIKMTIQGAYGTRLVSFLASLVLIYFIFKQIKAKRRVEEEHRLLDEVLSTTDDVIFITDFKEIKFSNRSFKELVQIESSLEYRKDVIDMFVVAEGFLHRGLLKKGETFSDLITRTSVVDRTVAILDKHLVLKVFKIDITTSKAKGEGHYLITLTDITKMKEQQTETEIKAYLDGLTGISNRNKFDEIIGNEMKNSQRYHRPLSMAILDIDKFKDFNDTYGHLIGDEVLIMLAQNVKYCIRETDVFARWGGEEFVLLFRETDVVQAKIVSDKIRKHIAELKHETAGSITASFGVTAFKDGDTLDGMFKRCDDALYKAKESGRNRVEVL